MSSKVVPGTRAPSHASLLKKAQSRNITKPMALEEKKKDSKTSNTQHATDRNLVYSLTSSTIIPCVSCKKQNKWNPGDYVQGYIYECSFCCTPFQHVVCPHCDTGQVWLASKELAKKWQRNINSLNPTFNSSEQEKGQASTVLRSKSIVRLPIRSLKNDEILVGRKQIIPTTQANEDHQIPLQLKTESLKVRKGIDLLSLHQDKKLWTAHHKRHSLSQGQITSEKWAQYCGFIEGQRYRCSNRTQCGKMFQIINCPSCRDTIHFESLDFMEGKLTQCPTCKFEFHKLVCTHCHIALCWNKDQFDETEIYTCPNCRGNFQKIHCSQCHQLNAFIPDEKGGVYDGKAFECVHCHRISESLEVRLSHLTVESESDSEGDMM